MEVHTKSKQGHRLPFWIHDISVLLCIYISPCPSEPPLSPSPSPSSPLISSLCLSPVFFLKTQFFSLLCAANRGVLDLCDQTNSNQCDPDHLYINKAFMKSCIWYYRMYLLNKRLLSESSWIGHFIFNVSIWNLLQCPHNLIQHKSLPLVVTWLQVCLKVGMATVLWLC